MQPWVPTGFWNLYNLIEKVLQSLLTSYSKFLSWFCLISHTYPVMNSDLTRQAWEQTLKIKSKVLDLKKKKSTDLFIWWKSSWRGGSKSLAMRASLNSATAVSAIEFLMVSIRSSAENLFVLFLWSHQSKISATEDGTNKFWKRMGMGRGWDRWQGKVKGGLGSWKLQFLPCAFRRAYYINPSTLALKFGDGKIDIGDGQTDRKGNWGKTKRESAHVATRKKFEPLQIWKFGFGL